MTFGRIITNAFDARNASADITMDMIYLVLNGTACLAVGIMLHHISAVRTLVSGVVYKLKSPPSKTSNANEDSEPEDEDVVAEKLKAQNYAANPQSDPEVALALIGMGKIYPNGKKAVDDFNLTVRAGEALALLGPNGCGKSTSMNIISGLFDATSGQVMIDGHPVTVAEGREHISLGVCPQHDRIWPELSVRDHLVLVLSLIHI